MRREELLARIRKASGVATVQDAERVLRTVIDALRTNMTEEQQRTVAGYLPDEFRADWRPDVGHPHDILEKEEMMFDAGIKR